MKKQWILLVVIMITVLLYAVFVIVFFIFKDEVKFQPAIFLVEYAKFLGTLTIAVISFFVIYIFWERRKKEIEVLSLYQQIDHFIFKIYRLLDEFYLKLKGHFTDGATEERFTQELRTFYINYLTGIESAEGKLTELFDKIEMSKKFLNEKYERVIRGYTDSIKPQMIQLISNGRDSQDILTFWRTHKELFESLSINLKELCNIGGLDD